MSEVEIHIDGNLLTATVQESRLPEWSIDRFEVVTGETVWRGVRIGSPEVLPDGRVRFRAERIVSWGDPGPLGEPGPLGGDSEGEPVHTETE